MTSIKRLSRCPLSFFITRTASWSNSPYMISPTTLGEPFSFAASEENRFLNKWIPSFFVDDPQDLFLNAVDVATFLAHTFSCLNCIQSHHCILICKALDPNESG